MIARISILLGSLLAGLHVTAQDIYFNDFNTVTPGMSMPTGWSQYNLDTLTPAFYMNPAIGNNGWSVAESPFVSADNELFSMSYFSQQTGTANDWLVSPHIQLPASGALLDFQVYNEGNSDFAVYVSTDPGNTLDDFLQLSPVYSLNNVLPDGDYGNFSIALTDFAGQTVRIAIRNQSTQGGSLTLDDFRVRSAVPNDVQLSEVLLPKYALPQTDNVLSFNVKNVGSNTVNSLLVNWNDGTDHSELFPVMIEPGETVLLSHASPVNYATVMEKHIQVVVSEVNGGPDSESANNELNVVFHTLSQHLQKRVVIEEGTGTWCGYCPRGAVAMEWMEAHYPENCIGIAVHNDDPMAFPEYNDPNAARLTGFPGANVDRVICAVEADIPNFEMHYNSRVTMEVPADLYANATLNGDELHIEASAIFHSVFTDAHFRLGVILTEDHVQGTSSGYAQTNYFSSTANNIPLTGAGRDWQSSPNPVPASQMEYNHVGRALLGGYDGQVGSVPELISDGQVVNYAFQFAIPQVYDRQNMHAVVVLIDQLTGEIVNAAAVSLNELSVSEIPSFTIQVFPNPADTETAVVFEADGSEYYFTLTDMSGRIISESLIPTTCGLQTTVVPLAKVQSGQYLLTVANGQTAVCRQLTVK